ncbi:ORF6N domain-containing protein [Sphingobacterium yanglingense]|uniref:ORF6N domain-containing protein n=1 Tax=Sphingobacterium yanglingense TaxID=1437280 RepID=UPI001060140A|nr:ORF6N domain-containing protein [Sphingobacterium yanglingense]
MFQLTKDEWRELIKICDNLPNGAKYSPATPFAFSEQGVAMLSSVLNSDRAVVINIQTIRIFTPMRQLIVENAETKLEIAKIKYAVEQITKKQKGHDQNIELLFEYIDRLQEKEESPPTKPNSKGEIGFKVGGK